MSEQFPAIKPTARSFTLGQLPTKIYRAMSGVTTKRSFGNQAYGYQIQLEFTNLNDSSTKQLIDHYTNSSGGFERFTLPDDLFAGMSTALKGTIQAPASIQWEYASPPDVTSAFNNRSSVRITLAGELTF
jgi:hypothetical protein